MNVEFNEDGSCEKRNDVVDGKWWDSEEREKFEDLEYETADEGEDEVDGYETASEEEFWDCCEEQKERQEDEVNEENGGTRMSKQETQEPRFFMMSDVRENSY